MQNQNGQNDGQSLEELIENENYPFIEHEAKAAVLDACEGEYSGERVYTLFIQDRKNMPGIVAFSLALTKDGHFSECNEIPLEDLVPHKDGEPVYKEGEPIDVDVEELVVECRKYLDDQEKLGRDDRTIADDPEKMAIFRKALERLKSQPC